MVYGTVSAVTFNFPTRVGPIVAFIWGHSEQTRLVHVPRITSICRRFQTMANRVILGIIAGIIAAASINALAVLLTISERSELERWAGAAFIVGLIVVAFTGILLVWGLFHPGQD